MNPPASTPESFAPSRPYLVGVDSDGCVFDGMEIKHKECFIPVTVKAWGLQPVSRFVRETWEFVNLYSRERASNRFKALVRTFDLLGQRPEIPARGAAVPRLDVLRAFVDSGCPLDHRNLQTAARSDASGELARTLAWSEAVNAAIADLVQGVPAFPFVRPALEKLHARADLVVISHAPTAALRREWDELGLADLVRAMCGQELGTKSQHLARTARGAYPAGRMLVIGDAPADLRAARDNGACFYPILPGDEAASWRRLLDQAADLFLSGQYAGTYEQQRIDEFLARLPERPPWAT
jgi:phosphoglycolate phosphatase-like HAD superfamily hydrolase